jgi:hypothetical protein
MYHLIVAHSALRWLLLGSIVWVVFRGWEGLLLRRRFSRADRIATAAASGLSHLQLLIGFGLYFQSPVAQGYWAEKSLRWSDGLFFALVHFGLMSAAVVVVTLGASLVKREADDRRRFQIMSRYFALALLLILAAIPWPFSPLAQRPWFREF